MKFMTQLLKTVRLWIYNNNAKFYLNM